MKKSTFIILITATAIALWVFGKLLPDIFLSIGKNAYLQKDYKTASDNLKFATILSPKNKDSRYYYVQTLIKLPPTLEIQKELFKISQENLPDSADLVADRQVSKWRNQISYVIGENYIEQVPFDNKILRWDASKFPLTVGFENDTNTAIPPYYSGEIKKAFLQWQAATSNLVRFNFIDNPNDAQILVKFMPIDESTKCTQAECKYVIAYTMPIIKGDLLKNMGITFYNSNNLGQPFSEREIYNTALHEIGHTLGIMGHSYNKSNLMYMQSGENDNFYQLQSDFQLIAPQDLNTLILLYKLIPDITNTPLNEFNTKGQFFAPIIMGSKKEITSRKIQEAQNYIKSAPNLAGGYIDLATAYAEQKEHTKAIENLEKALELSSTDDERFVVCYNLAVIYMNIKDWENSLKYAQMAKQNKSSEEIEELINKLNTKN